MNTRRGVATKGHAKCVSLANCTPSKNTRRVTAYRQGCSYFWLVD